MTAPTSPSVNFTPAKGSLRLEDEHGVLLHMTVKAETAWTAAAALRAVAGQLEEQLEARESTRRTTTLEAPHART